MLNEGRFGALTVDRRGFTTMSMDMGLHAGVRAIAGLAALWHSDNFVLLLPTLLMMLAERRVGMGTGDRSVLMQLMVDTTWEQHALEPYLLPTVVVSTNGDGGGDLERLGECRLDLERLEVGYLRFCENWGGDNARKFVKAVRRELYALSYGCELSRLLGGLDLEKLKRMAQGECFCVCM